MAGAARRCSTRRVGRCPASWRIQPVQYRRRSWSHRRSGNRRSWRRGWSCSGLRVKLGIPYGHLVAHATERLGRRMRVRSDVSMGIEAETSRTRTTDLEGVEAEAEVGSIDALANLPGMFPSVPAGCSEDVDALFGSQKGGTYTCAPQAHISYALSRCMLVC